MPWTLLEIENGVRLERLARDYWRVRVPETTWTIEHDYYYDRASLARHDFGELANLAGFGKPRETRGNQTNRLKDN